MPENSTIPDIWRILDLINWTTDYLQSREFPSPRTDVEWLLTSVLDCSRVDLYTNFEKPLNSDELTEFKQLLKRRVNHEPVQYIIGKTEFMGLPFRVNESVLIPRPETEILVEHAIDWFRARSEDARKILDIGTGSGCIAVSLAKFVDAVSAIAIDLSDEALAVASQNADLNEVSEKITFQQLNILEKTPPDIPFDLIVSNPPYIDQDDYERLQRDIREYEPDSALIADETGLAFYRQFAENAQNWLAHNGLLLCEIGGTHQSESIRQLFEKSGWQNIRILKDYNTQDRLLFATSSSTD